MLADGAFYVQGLGNRCVDFGGQAWWALGAPVFIYGCNGTVAQQVRLREIDSSSHDVELRVQSLFCIGVRGGQVTRGQPLELQACNGSPAQRFAVDGDALLMGSQASGRVAREYVIEPDQGRTENRTPLVVGDRDLSEPEYFRFRAVDGSGRRPTSGFVRAWDDASLDSALASGWGSVIEVDDASPLVVHGPEGKRIGPGVTVRGYRKHTDQGPEIVAGPNLVGAALTVDGDHVRVTGLRLRGRSDVAGAAAGVSAILVTVGPSSGVMLDHLDVGYWTGSAIDVRGPDDPSQECPGLTESPRQVFARAVGNFLHHNDTYGVVAGSGAFVVAQGNVLYGNAHAIASDPWGRTGYAAYDNFVLSQVAGSHDFDAHGSLHPPHWYDGLSGDYFDVGWNTFLPTGHPNFKQRGTPCRFLAFHDNLTLQSAGASVTTLTTEPVRHVVWANHFGGVPHPTSDLAVGDFDGDGIDDVFAATGVGWYFSSGGQAEWRFLNRMPERTPALRFGDFDGDQRTDVLALHGADLVVSWGGASPWQAVNGSAFPIEDLAVGDFDGNGRADLLMTTGAEWFYAPGARNWTPYAVSSFRASQLRFGDFNGDHRTDVLGVVSGWWQVVTGPGQTWQQVRPALTTTLAGLVVGDFDGDGISDLAGNVSGAWRYSKSARSDWTFLRPTSDPLTGRPIGRFDGNATTDAVIWSGGFFNYAVGGSNPIARLSRQLMR